VDVTAELDADCLPEVLFDWVDDLGRYPSWLDIVPRAEVVPSSGPEPAWLVDLRGRLGPLARSKRLRMVRTVHESPTTAVFERHELDGRSHAPWVLRAEVTAVGTTGSRLTMHLHYGGGLWAPVLERVLGDEIERSRPRLLRRIDGDRAGG
jgi:Polyketide cyclase / dehydrase and lipid transport